MISRSTSENFLFQILVSVLLCSGVGRAQPMPGHSMGTLRLRISYPGHAQLSAACSTEMQKQLSGRTTVAEVPYMEGFICKRKSYVDAGRV